MHYVKKNFTIPYYPVFHKERLKHDINMNLQIDNSELNMAGSLNYLRTTTDRETFYVYKK